MSEETKQYVLRKPVTCFVWDSEEDGLMHISTETTDGELLDKAVFDQLFVVWDSEEIQNKIAEIVFRWYDDLPIATQPAHNDRMVAKIMRLITGGEQ